MKVYKVVSIRGGCMYSCRTSAVKPLNSPAVLQYIINKVTRPNFGYIYCFKCEEVARVFAMHYSYTLTTAVLEGIGIPVGNKEIPRTVSIKERVEDMAIMWKHSYTNCRRVAIAPRGTVLMCTFRPLKEVIRYVI